MDTSLGYRTILAAPGALHPNLTSSGSTSQRRSEEVDMTVTPLRERAAWKALERHHAEIAGRSLRELFAEDPGRGKRFAAEAAGIYLDYSKNLIDAATLRLLLDLAEESDLP